MPPPPARPLAALALFVGLAAVVPAQDAPAPTVRLFLRTPKDTRADEVEVRLKRALAAAGYPAAGLTLKRIMQSEYEMLLRLTDLTVGEPAKGADPAAKPGEKAAELVMMKKPHLRIPRPAQDIVKVAVDFESGKTAEYTLGAAKGGLSLLTGDWYQVELPENEHPTAYRGYYAKNDKADKPDVTGSLKTGLCFSVVITGLGDDALEKLRDVLKSKKHFTNELDVTFNTRQTFAFADGVAKYVKPTGTVVRRDRVEFTDTDATLRDRATRLWVYLPAGGPDPGKGGKEPPAPRGEKEAADLAKGFNARFNAFTLPDEIRKTRIDGDKDFALAPDMKPGWVEVPKGPDGAFARVIPLRDPNGWARKYPDLWYLVAYEFQPDPAKEEYEVAKLDDKDGAVLVVPRKLDGWAEGLAGKK